MFKCINICWVTKRVSKHQAVAILNLTPALWPDEYFIMLQVKQLSSRRPGLLSPAAPQHNTAQPADHGTFPRKMGWFAWVEEGVQPSWVPLTMPSHHQRWVFLGLFFQPCLAGHWGQLFWFSQSTQDGPLKHCGQRMYNQHVMVGQVWTYLGRSEPFVDVTSDPILCGK